MTRIIVAFPKAENGKNIKNVLVRNGYQVVCVCTNGAQVIQEANGLQDGIVVCTYKLSDMIYQELVECLPPGFDTIVISTKDQWVENGTPGIVGLAVPLKIHELLSTVEMVSYNRNGNGGSAVQAATKTNERRTGTGGSGKGDSDGTKSDDGRRSTSLPAKDQYG